jgi:hypothetical protein
MESKKICDQRNAKLKKNSVLETDRMKSAFVGRVELEKAASAGRCPA